MQVHFKQLRPGAALPARATEGAAAADLLALCGEEGITLAPGQRALVPTGLAMELPGSGYVALVFARSGLAAKQGIALANGVGVIDSDYRGEVQVALINLSDAPYTVQSGERVAQLAVLPVAAFSAVWAEVLTETDRGAGGFGSTGKR